MKYLYFAIGASMVAGGLFGEIPLLLGFTTTVIGFYIILTGFEQ